MHKLLFGVLFAISFAQAARAEGAETTPPPDSHLAAALDLLDSNGSMKSVSNILDAIAPLQAQEIRRQRPNIDEATLASLQKAVKDEIVAREGEYKLIIAQVYEHHFTEEELRALAAFYRSDIGKKYVGTMPDLIKELAPVGTAWAEGVAADAIKRVLNRLKSQGDHT